MAAAASSIFEEIRQDIIKGERMILNFYRENEELNKTAVAGAGGGKDIKNEKKLMKKKICKDLLDWRREFDNKFYDDLAKCREEKSGSKRKCLEISLNLP